MSFRQKWKTAHRLKKKGIKRVGNSAVDDSCMPAHRHLKGLAMVGTTLEMAKGEGSSDEQKRSQKKEGVN